MTSSDHILNSIKLLASHRRTLTLLLDQCAAQGGRGFAAPAVINGIEEAQSEIQRIKGALRAAGIEVADDVSDTYQPRTMRRSGDTLLGSQRILRTLHTGSNILRVLLADMPILEGAIGQLRGIFSGAASELKLLRVYKDLHDCLHTLQLECYIPLENELEKLHANEHSSANIACYLDKVQDLINDMEDIFADARELTLDRGFVVTLEQAGTAARQALHSDNEKRLQFAVMQIGRTLNLYLPILDSKMSDALRRMRFGDMIEVLLFVRNTCHNQQIDAVLITELEALLARLDEEANRLRDLVEHHQQWQRIDSLLCTIDSSFDLYEPGMWWPELREQALTLYASATEQWAIDMQSSAARIDQAVDDQDVFGIRQSFCKYRSYAVKQFFRVDRKLKRMCEQLRQYDGPLGPVIQVIE